MDVVKASLNMENFIIMVRIVSMYWSYLKIWSPYLYDFGHIYHSNNIELLGSHIYMTDQAKSG